MRQKIMKYALQNAVFYEGKANPKAVLGKVLGSEPSLRPRAGQVRLETEQIVSEVNRLTLEEQKKKLEALAPELMVKEEKEQEELPPLAGAVEGKVVTRFAPCPSGPLNIAHLLRAVMISYLYAEKYKGRFLLRFEDTDPTKVRREYYGMIKEDLKSSGVRVDKVIIQSRRMGEYLKRGEQLILEGNAYMCTCPAEGFRELKLKKQNCPCRDNSPKTNLGMWEKALKGGYKPGEITTRLKTSMRDPNPVLRDPPLFRVMKEKHPLVGTRYKYWPLYNMANCIDDYDYGVTHVFRGKEHEHNTAVQRMICNAFGWEPPAVVNFGMIYQPGQKIHTRDMKEWIKKGKVSGWDDPSLNTVRALLRRGYTKEAFREYALQCGLTKHDIIMNWETFDAMNKKVIDILADRYRAVEDPVEIDISRCLREWKTKTPGRIKVPVHPDKPDMREIEVRDKIVIPKADYKRFRGKNVRLIDLFNVNLSRKPSLLGGQSHTDIQKIQWVSSPGVRAELVFPEEKRNIITEKAVKSLKPGDRVQFLRIGFCLLEKSGRKPVFMFTHK